MEIFAHDSHRNLHKLSPAETGVIVMETKYQYPCSFVHFEV